MALSRSAGAWRPQPAFRRIHQADAGIPRASAAFECIRASTDIAMQ